MQANGHVCRTSFQAIVVRFDIRIKQSRMINSKLLHALDHRVRAEVSEERVIELDITTAYFIELFDFLLVCNCNVGEIFSCLWYVSLRTSKNSAIKTHHRSCKPPCYMRSRRDEDGTILEHRL